MRDELAARITAAAQAGDFAGAVQVTVAGTPVFVGAFGEADRSHAILNTSDTRFGIASGSKLITALGVGALVDEGRLALDTRLRDVVAVPLPGVSPDVTIDHLLSHTSGVHDYLDEEQLESADTVELPIAPFKLLGPRDYVPLLVAGEARFAPGTRFSYCNSGYVLLGLAIEAVAACSFHELVEQRVLARARMDASGYFRFDRLPRRVASGYVRSAQGWRTNIYTLPIIGGPDGGAYATVDDLERLWTALFAGELLSPALTRTFLQKVGRDRDGLFYGRGMWIEDDGVQPPCIYVEGRDAGVSFRSTCYAEHTIATVVSNTSDGAWPMIEVVDRFVREQVPVAQRGFRVALEP